MKTFIVLGLSLKIPALRSMLVLTLTSKTRPRVTNVKTANRIAFVVAQFIRVTHQCRVEDMTSSHERSSFQPGAEYLAELLRWSCTKQKLHPRAAPHTGL